VLEHVEDDRKALAELFRILKPEGWGIIMVPINLAVSEIDEDPAVTDEAERWRRFGQFDHVRRYSKQGFLHRVQSAGFAVDQLGVDFFSKEVFHRSGISSTSVLYIVNKIEKE
jgi:ubiquinone/menaquinone biosynthesis C-methylase UbiE